MSQFSLEEVVGCRVGQRSSRGSWAAAQRSLLGMAYLLTQDLPLAEDVVQEALFKVYRRWRREGMAAHPEAYVRRVVVNEFINTRRRRWSAEVPSTGELPGSAMADGSPVERLMMWQALTTLPTRQRSACAALL